MNIATIQDEALARAVELIRNQRGWAQIPPKQDGWYWLASESPWDSEQAFDNVKAVQIDAGKRVRETINDEGFVDECDTDLVWDYCGDDELCAAWYKTGDGESITDTPPFGGVVLYERHPSRCCECNGLGAIYRTGMGKPNVFICYGCGRTVMVDALYFEKKFGEALEKAMRNAGDL